MPAFVFVLQTAGSRFCLLLRSLLYPGPRLQPGPDRRPAGGIVFFAVFLSNHYLVVFCMLWDAVRNSLASTLPASEYELWIKPLVCQGDENDAMVLAGPDRFFCAWVEQRYLELIRQQHLAAGGQGRVALRVAGSGAPAAPDGRQLRLPGLPRHEARLRSLHPAFTFDQFMVGESNILAQSACKALALNDYTFGRCLFMSSETGLGKSHLTQAVVHQVLRSAPATRLRYLTAQQFSAEMVQGLRTRTMDRFAERYLDDCDMLLLEDVHTLTGKNKTQEELNVVLDSLLKSGRRVILTSSLPPDRISGLDTDFKSRMTSGLLASIQAPAFETRVRIIQHKLAAQNMAVAGELVEYMAEQLTGDIRRMESAVMNVRARCRLRGSPPDLAMIREVLDGFACMPAQLTAEAICQHISSRFRVGREDLCSRSRKRSIVFPRQVAIYLTRKFTGHSLAEIGALYRRDHSTVLHAIRTITQKMAQNTAVREQVDLLTKDLEKRR